MRGKQLERYYCGTTAENYDRKRVNTRKWQDEQRAVEYFLEELSKQIDVIDIPVGTGRFFCLFAMRKDNVVGVDISSDMLEVARQNPAAAGVKLKLTLGNIFNLNLESKSFDCAICIRFLNLVDSVKMIRALSELGRLASSCIIVGIRFIPNQENRTSTISTLFITARWAWLTFVKYPRGKVFFHTENQVRTGIKNANLTVRKEIIIEDSQNGTRYSIYMLVPKATNLML